MSNVHPPTTSDDWVALVDGPLPSSDVATSWLSRPDCGAVVVFSGLVRNHAEGRPGVSQLEYEAYAEQVEPRLAELAGQARVMWPSLRRVVLWHRTGTLEVGEVSVVVGVATPHRADSFEASSWCIDTLKATAPIWKRERWEGGEDWGCDAQDVAEVAR